MSAAAETNGKSMWGLIASVAGAAVVVCGAIGGMALTPLSIKADSNQKAIEDLRARFEAHAQLSGHPVTLAETRRLDDRISSNDRITADTARDLGILQSSYEAHKSRIDSDLIEIETQFDADSQFRNIQFSDQQRTNAVIWEHIPELGKYPVSPYFQPNISNRKDKK